MQDFVKETPEPVKRVPGSVKGMAAVTVITLVVATAYSVALGGDGLLWFAWVVLGLLTLGMVTAEGS